MQKGTVVPMFILFIIAAVVIAALAPAITKSNCSVSLTDFWVDGECAHLPAEYVYGIFDLHVAQDALVIEAFSLVTGRDILLYKKESFYPIAVSTAFEANATVSADGLWVVFEYNNDEGPVSGESQLVLYSIVHSGSELITQGFEPDFGANGELAYSAYNAESGSADIWILNPDSSQPVAIERYGFDICPDFSIDGNWISFVSNNQTVYYSLEEQSFQSKPESVEFAKYSEVYYFDPHNRIQHANSG